MADTIMMFPDTVEEFMEQYKIIDTEKVYTNGAELVPIFRMKQWFDHIRGVPYAERRGRWIAYGLEDGFAIERYICSECNYDIGVITKNYCPNCGAQMEE